MNQNQIQSQNEKKESIEIDFVRLFSVLWHRAWIIALCTILVAVLAFGYSSQFITPKYRSNIQIYVDNVDNTITTSGLAAAQSLVTTYIEILKSRPSLERIIEEADLDMTTAQLSSMISAKAVNSTEIFEVTVSGEDRLQTVVIANAIATVFEDVVKNVIRQAQVGIVEWADGSDHQYAPNVSLYTFLGGFIGLFLSVAFIMIKYFMDPYVKSEEDITSVYGIPLLAVIPGSEKSKSKYGKYRHYNHYYQRADRQNNDQ